MCDGLGDSLGYPSEDTFHLVDFSPIDLDLSPVGQASWPEGF